MKLSPSFSEVEFYSGIIPANSFKFLEQLCNKILEPIREFLNCSIKVTSGYRSIEDYSRLKKAGYHPSETSDHYAGTPIPLASGKMYFDSVGAADIIPAIGAEKAFNILLAKTDREKGIINLPIGPVIFGQMIFESDSVSKHWIHISNPSPIKRQHVLVSLDGGKSYHAP